MSDVHTAKAKPRAGVIGFPIAHSKSPIIHRYWLEKHGLAGEYMAYEIAPDILGERLLSLRDDGLRGVNVTLPHKQAVMRHCTTLTQDATRIGAVNTVVFHANGEIEGRNTDAHGFMANLQDNIADRLWLTRPVLVLGAGGAARAVVHAMKRDGAADIRLANRSLENAETLGEDFKIEIVEWEKRDAACADCALVVNTTSLGMTGKPALQLDLTGLRDDAAVCDIVYAPLITPLLHSAQSRGLRTVTGIGMLLHQAAPAFAAFFGPLPEIDAALTDRVLA